MEFLSACYQQKEGNSSSLLLQQYQYRHSQIVFACICAKEDTQNRIEDGRAEAYITERLLTWFRGLNLKKLMKSREKKADILAEELVEVIGKADRELEEGRMAERGRVGIAGIICVDDIFIMVYRGTPAIYMINTGFGRVHLSRLSAEGEIEKLTVRPGVMEPDVGLLFATKGFYCHITETMIKEGLFVREISTEEQLERRLTELGREGERRGGSGIGVVMLRTVM